MTFKLRGGRLKYASFGKASQIQINHGKVCSSLLTSTLRLFSLLVPPSKLVVVLRYPFGTITGSTVRFQLFRFLIFSSIARTEEYRWLKDSPIENGSLFSSATPTPRCCANTLTSGADPVWSLCPTWRMSSFGNGQRMEDIMLSQLTYVNSGARLILLFLRSFGISRFHQE